MIFPWSKKPAVAPRVFLTSDAVAGIVLGALGGVMRSRNNLWIGDSHFVATSKDEIMAVAKKAWKPWFGSAGGGNCDAQARRVKVFADEELHLQKLEAGLAIGSFWTSGPLAHAYTFGIDDKSVLHIYNQTSGWFEPRNAIDTPITLVVI